MDLMSNNSLNFNNTNNDLGLKTWMNIWTLLNTIFATIISLFILIYVIVIYILKKKSKKSFHVSLILTCNTCLTIICSSMTFSLLSLSSILGDFNRNSHRRFIISGCYIRGYLTYVFITSMYLSYVLQACYRLFRIVYHKYKYLRTAPTFLYYILIQWIISFLITSPILFLNKNYSSFIIYLSEDFYCLVSFTDLRGVTYVSLITYISPICALCLIYARIIIHIRTKNGQIPSTVKLRRQNKRDTTVLKRIYTVIIILWILGISGVVFFVEFMITGKLHWTAYRIFCMTVSITFLFISSSSLYVTPQIYKRIRTLFGCKKHHKKHHPVPYAITINIERERKIESLLLENTTPG